MPTQADFELAAEKFTTAAALIRQLGSTANSAGASLILRGGTLGRRVPERIAATVGTAASCEQAILQAIDTCLERAAIIASYQEQLAAYDLAVMHFDAATRSYAWQYNAWFLDETGTIGHPGDAPTAPRKPMAPPDWAEVRRP